MDAGVACVADVAGVAGVAGVTGVTDAAGAPGAVPRTVTLEIPNKGTGFKLKIVGAKHIKRLGFCGNGLHFLHRAGSWASRSSYKYDCF